MGETADELMRKAYALREKGNRALDEAEALFARAEDLYRNGGTRLQNAIINQEKAWARSLIKAGEDVNETGTQDHRPPLVLALYIEDPLPLVKALLKAGANPNAKTGVVGAKAATTILALALKLGRYQSALELLKAGANPKDREAKAFIKWMLDGGMRHDGQWAIKEIHGLLGGKS